MDLSPNTPDTARDGHGTGIADDIPAAPESSGRLPLTSHKLPFSALPEANGLYNPRFEHDSCGVGFVVDVTGAKSHDIVATALGALCNLDHRGASGAEVNTGDGAGILIQVPDAFLRSVTPFALPPAGAYGVGLAFLPLAETGA